MKNGNYELVIAPQNYPGKKYRDKYCLEHTLVWWQNTKILPKKNEVLHHKNGNKRDNHFKNLKLFTRKKHDKYHGAKSIERYRIKCTCPICRNTFIIRGGQYRVRLKRNVMKKVFCSRSCATIYQFNNIPT